MSQNIFATHTCECYYNESKHDTKTQRSKSTMNNPSQKYTEELDFITKVIKEAYQKLANIKIDNLIDKAKFDLVTVLDYEMEKYISAKISEKYPNDRIHGEEGSSNTEIIGRTWTIDPIDGTYNMANKSPLFGVQCSMFDKGEPVVAAIYLPFADEMYSAALDFGAYLNGNPISVAKPDLSHSVVSFGDFPHSRPSETKTELKILAHLSDKIARIRMFGAASIDYAYVASGKTHGVVIYTKNKWDIAPGILLCKEAGAVTRSLDTSDGTYNFDSPSVITTSTDEIYECIKESI